MKKTLVLLLSLCLALMQWAGAAAGGVTVAEIQKYGNLVLSISASDFLAQGYAYGDVITAQIGSQTFAMPVGTNYSDVDNGNPVCRVTDGQVILAINMGDLATTSGIAIKTKIDEEPGYRWEYTENVHQPTQIILSMKEPGGYYDEYVMRQLTRTNERQDYAALSDAQFANFRKVETTGMGLLYRSSSPVNPELNRSGYADAAMESAGIKTVVNLADTDEGLRVYEGYEGSYYQGCGVIALNLGVDFTAPDFQTGLARGLRFMIQHKGPYLIHCTEGKDRAGFTAAVLASLMGASAEEVVADYMITYENYYGVSKGSEQYQAIARSNIEKSLEAAFGVEDIFAADMSKAAETYLIEKLALTPQEVVELKVNLSQ